MKINIELNEKDVQKGLDSLGREARHFLRVTAQNFGEMLPAFANNPYFSDLIVQVVSSNPSLVMALAPLFRPMPQSPHKAGPLFECPNCGCHEWGSSAIEGSDNKWMRHCHGRIFGHNGDARSCRFSWHCDDDAKYGITNESSGEQAVG